MSHLLESYAAGRWFAASNDGTPLLDAATGEEVARISSAGLDLGEMTTYARAVGGPALPNAGSATASSMEAGSRYRP